MWESYSAFAKCYGGVIILGVKENEDGSWQMTGSDNAVKVSVKDRTLHPTAAGLLMFGEEYGPDDFNVIFCGKSGDKKVAIKSGDKKKMSKKTEQQLEAILEYMNAEKEYKTSEIADFLGVKDSRAGVLVNELVESGKLQTIGKNKGRKYKII